MLDLSDRLFAWEGLIHDGIDRRTEKRAKTCGGGQLR